MLYIIYNNQTNFIVSARLDLSTPAPAPAEYWFSDFVETHNAVSSEYTIIVHPDSNAKVILGRDMYNPDTRSIVADPNWVAPVSTPTPAEPTV